MSYMDYKFLELFFQDGAGMTFEGTGMRFVGLDSIGMRFVERCWNKFCKTKPLELLLYIISMQME